MADHETQLVVQATCNCGQQSPTRGIEQTALVEDWAVQHRAYHDRVAVLTQRQEVSGQDAASERRR